MDTFVPFRVIMKKMRVAALIGTCAVILAGVAAGYKLGFDHSNRLQAGSTRSVLLNWAPSPSLTATGYNVYRSEVSGSSYQLITPNHVKGLTYTDRSAQAGRTYYYVATTV